MDALLLRAHDRVSGCPLCARIVIFTRLLLASGFVLPGMIKLLGHRFTALGVDTPVGAFFEALYQTDEYWRFIGLTQVVAAILILLPRLTLVGASVFFGVVLNIAVLTNAIGFVGTRYVALLMLAATALLLFWDYPALRPFLGLDPAGAPARLTPVRIPRLEWAGAILATTLAWYSTLFAAGILGVHPILSLASGGAFALAGGALLFGPILRQRWCAAAPVPRG